MNDNNYTTKSVSRKVYKNICVKLKNRDDIFDIGCIISSSQNDYDYKKKDYQIISRFYKIQSEDYMISFEYILKILKKIYPIEISYKIIEFYLKNNVSFKSISVESSKTLKITTDIKYLGDLYQKNTIYNSSQIGNYLCDKIITKIIDNFIKLLNDNIFFDINDIFFIKNDSEIDFCVIHKILNCREPFHGWGMYLDKQIDCNMF